MSTLSVPFITDGTILTGSQLGTFTSNATTARQNLVETNLSPQSIGLQQWNSTDGVLNRYGAVVQTGGSGSFSSSSYVELQHNSQSTSYTFSPAITSDRQLFVVARLQAVVGVADTTNNGYIDDQYYFRFGYNNNSVWTYPSNHEWGFSILVRNSTGTQSTDADIDTHTYDEKNCIRWRHVDICTTVPIQNNSLSISAMRWEIKVGDTDNAIPIHQFSATYQIFQG